MPERPPRPDPPSRRKRDSLASLGAVTLAVLGLGGAAMTGAIVFGDSVFVILGVILLFGGVTALHYVTWGHWLLQQRTAEDEVDTTFHQRFTFTPDGPVERQ